MLFRSNTTTINSNVITTNDKTITVANNQSTGANVNGAGIEAGNPAIATWLYNDLTTSWQSNVNLTPTSNVTLNLGTNTNRWATVYAQDANLSGTATATAFVGNGSGLTSLTGANVTGTVANATYATTAGHASTANTVTDAAQANITSVGTLVSLAVTGNITSSGNIAGTYFLGNGSQLTGLPEVYGNANVANFLANYGSNTIVTTGNITGGNVITTGNVTGNGATITNDLTVGNWINTGAVLALSAGPAGLGISTTGRLQVVGSSALQGGGYLDGDFQQLSGNLSTTGNFTATGNVQGSYILGNGSQLTGITSTYGDANVTTLLASLDSNTIVTTGNITGGNLLGTIRTAAQPNITSVGTLTSLSVSGSGSVNGNANVNGNLTVGTELRLMDEVGGGDWVAIQAPAPGFTTWTLTLPENDGTSGQFLRTDGTGVTTWATPTSSYGNTQVAAFLADLGANIISSTANITTTANVSGAYVIGNGSALSSLTGANVTGQVANALVAGTVYTAAQPAITSVGTLTGLTVSGNIATGNILTDGYYYANGTPVSFGGTYGNAEVADFLANFGSNTISSKIGRAHV
mgnify:FL=1